MLIPIIKVKDGDYEHIVGTNSHDVLYVDERTGGIQYLSIQSYAGTAKYGDEREMQFVTEQIEEYDVFGAQIRFVTIEELFEIAIQNMKDSTESKLKLHEMMRKYWEAKKECQEKLDHEDVWDTSGALPF